MMTTTNRLYAPTRALPAIAAALALSSTSALAQEAAQPAPPVTTEPAPATTTVQPTPAPTEPAPATDSATPAPAADTATEATTTTVKQSVKRTTRTASARPAPVTRTATRTVTTRTVAPAATAAATPKPAAAPPPTPQTAPPAPVVSLSTNPPPAKPAAAQPATADETLPIAGGALALLALGGTAAALMSRRRRRREQEWADEQAMAYEPVETVPEPEPEAAMPEEPIVHAPEPAMAGASAFAWGNEPRADDTTRTGQPTADADDDRRPGESWVERAYRGPTPNNPSVSLRNRLGRAAFFDKREREAAAGLAEPVDPSAGLPEAMVEEQEREPA